MPSGRCTPLKEEVWEAVRKEYDNAVKHGLQYEWLRWYSGGIAYKRLHPVTAAEEAAIEWDI